MTDVQEYATNIVKRLVRKGYTAYFAGGWVRDYLMGHPSSDIDIATDAPPQVILDLFPRTILVGLDFGVVIVAIDGHMFEVATFRKDLDYIHGRKPEKIEFATPREDAERRDFTINGMFYDPLEDQIHDFIGGREDIERRIIRTIGNPNERFVEDRLRMIRAIRFSARFCFTIDSETQKAIRENADTLFPAVAMERIQQEFNKMASFPRFDQAILDMHRLGLLSVIFPALEKIHLHDLEHLVGSFSFFPKQCPLILYLQELFPEASVEQMVDLCLYLKMSRQDQKLITFFMQSRPMLLCQREGSPIEWTRFYAHPSADICVGVIAAHFDPEQWLIQHTERKKQLSRHINRMQSQAPLVSAKLLQEEGIPPGELLGKLLKEAEKIAVNQDLHDPEAVIRLLKEYPLWGNS